MCLHSACHAYPKSIGLTLPRHSLNPVSVLTILRLYPENARSLVSSHDRLPDQPGFSCFAGDRKKTIMRV